MANYDELATRSDSIVRWLYSSFKDSVKQGNPIHPKYFAIYNAVLDILLEEYGNSGVPYVHRAYLKDRIESNWDDCMSKGE